MPPGLRERKKHRTRHAIERAAIELFTKRGFQATTLADIAAAAEVAPSTLYTYFPSKSDIVFSRNTEILESARHRLLNRPEHESTIEALDAWISIELPALAESRSSVDHLRRTIIESDQDLLDQDRLRIALLEDVFSEAFGRDLRETPDDLRPRLMAALAVAGLRAVWMWSYRHHPAAEFDPREPYSLDHTYLTRILAAAKTAIEQIPRPD